MPETQGPTDDLSALTSYLVGEESLGATLTRVSELARRSMFADMAGITMLVEGKPSTAVFTDPDTVEIDVGQYASGRGPCLEAFRTGTVVSIGSVEADGRWPEFARQAAQYGIRSTLSLPMMARTEPLGALNLYSRREHNFDRSSAETGLRFARQAAIALTNARVYEDARELNDNLKQAMESRSTIDHAIGALIASSGHSPQEAFQLLIRASQRENRKLREVAVDVVERAQRRHRPPGAADLHTPHPE